MNRNIFIHFIVGMFFFIGTASYAQINTIGLLYLGSNITEGYTLFTPEENSSVYLINNCGEKINEWTFSEVPGATCYLLENGNLLRAGKDSLEIRDWDNNLVWSYAMNVNGIKQHHDIEPLPNGNILCVVTDVYSSAEIIALGRDSNNVTGNFKLDKIVEIQPVGSNDANMVWEWKFIDHLIQDFDNTKPGYGVVANHPELLDINYENNQPSDWTHINAVDYNAALDQVMITARHLSELYVVDHSTTTAEAASHSGGNSNMGGDFLWRWGNPAVYRQGGVSDQKIFSPHDGKWVEPNYQDEGKVTVFNNGGDSTNTFSSIHLITPEIVGGVYQKSNSVFLPASYEWSWQGNILGHVFRETRKSGTHALPNGNFVICESFYGQVSEINRNGDLLWTYRNPSGTIVYSQFDSLPILDNTMFRAEKYPVNYIGFSGKDLTPKGLIENHNAHSDSCIVYAGIEDMVMETINIRNPVENGIIRFSKSIEANEILIVDINGRTVYHKSNFIGISFPVDLHPGMYFLQIRFDKAIVNKKILVK